MSFDALPQGLSQPALRKIDHHHAIASLDDDVSDFRHFAEQILRAAPDFVEPGELYATLCDLAANHPIYLTDYEAAKARMDDWNDLTAISHDALPRLEAAIEADALI